VKGAARHLSVGLVFALLAVLAAPALAGPGDQQAREQKRRDRRSTADQVVDTPKEVDALQAHQHGPTEGHLPPSRRNMRLVGQADIEGVAPERVADVSAFGNYAYLTVRDPANCFDAGVAIMDISDPRNPRQVGFIDATEGSFPGEGSQVVDLNTRAFQGQVLVFNNEICDPGANFGGQGIGGVSLWDVTDPLNPQVLTANIGDQEPGGLLSQFNEIHSSFAWQAGRRAFVVLVDNEETTDVDIMDITDPRTPIFLSESDLNEEAVLQDRATPLGAASFLHDVVVKRVKGTWTMLLSYWDGGWVLLDVDRPARPRFIDDYDYPTRDSLTGLIPSEGNAHQAEFSPRNAFIVGTDEDFAPYRIDPFLITSGPNAGQEFEAAEFGFTVPIAQRYEDEQVNGPTIWGGLGCPSNDIYGEQPAIPDASALETDPGEEKIVVLSRGLCFFSEKIEQGQLAGYDVVIIGNHHEGAAGGAAPDAALCGSQGHPFEPTASAICIGHRAMHLLFNDQPEYEPVVAESPDMPDIGTLGEEVRAQAIFDGWGYVRLLRTGNLSEVDAYAIDEALDPAFAFGFGALSVHEVAVDPWKPGLAYLAYYSGGMRTIRYGPRGIREVGHFVGREGSNFWGVEVHRLPGSNRTLILGSDRDSGLWIFRFTPGPAAGGVRLVADLSGANEVPGPGDANGRGHATVRLSPRAGRVCYSLHWSRIDAPFAAHIHVGSADEAGDVVVTLFEGEPVAGGSARDCVGGLDSSLLRAIARRPGQYYVNVHNEDFPAGAIRGQLRRT
jgi:hypothetical protein